MLAALLATACHPDEERILRPLPSASFEPDVLVEDSTLPLRPSLGGNRFLSGWRPVRRRGKPALALQQGSARLEVVHLGERPRVLALDLVDETFDPDGRISVRAAARDLGTRTLTDPLEIPLPADLPPGRILVELRLETPKARLEVHEGRLRPDLPAGEARWHEGGLVQSGTSRVDFVLRPTPGQSLVGRFAPPSGARPEQSFQILLESEDGSRSTTFAWAPSVADLLRRRRFEIPLGSGGEFVRVSLEAAGEGPPGRWTGLAVSGRRTSAAQEEAPVDFEPPGLVLLYVMDALRADAVSHLGGRPDATPVVDRLAHEGVSFREHRSVAPNTLPSTKALLTGEAWVDRGGWRLPADGPATLAELFRRAGYRTALFSGNTWVGPSYGVDRGFEHVSEAAVSESPSAYNDNAERLHEAALEWLRALTDGDRVFLYVHTVHPHNPYDPPEPWRSELTRGIDSDIDGSTKTLLAIGRRRIRPGEADRERLRRLYAGGLAYNDAQLGSFLAELGRLFHGERALVVVTSDHGEELFDHGGVLHGYTLYEEMIRIPLVVWSPGLVVPGMYTRPTSTLDLHATLAEIAARAAGPPPETASEGRSLVPFLLDGQERDPDVHLASAASVKGGIYSVQSPRWKLVWAPRTGREQGMGGGPGRTRSSEYLFDLAADPEERRNRAGEGGLEVAWMRSRLEAWIEAKKARGEDEGGAEVDEETRKRLEALGYVD